MRDSPCRSGRGRVKAGASPARSDSLPEPMRYGDHAVGRGVGFAFGRRNERVRTAEPCRRTLDWARPGVEAVAVNDVKTTVEELVRTAARAALGTAGDVDPLVRAAKDPKFGDYQANVAMSLGKSLGRKPRELAELIAAELVGATVAEGAGLQDTEPAVRQAASEPPILSDVEVAGPGFINLTLSSAFIQHRTCALFEDARLGVAKTLAPQTVVVDYCSPNLAKEMHVGHLRSTIIGDTVCRILEFRGDRVIRQNHVGDWGTAFGMLLEHLIDTGWDERGEHTIGDLNELYREAKARFDNEADFADRARRRVVLLQGGEERALRLWRLLIDESVRHMNDVCGRLGVLLTDDDLRPESFYNSELPDVVRELEERGIAVRDQGAMVAFPEGFTNKAGEPLPLIVQKRDGGFGYAATDLAAGRFRVRQLGAQRVVYVVDSRQADHFAMVFSTLRRAGWAPPEVSLEHVAFGMILGKDRKPFKSRSGDNVRLTDVLHEAEERALKVLDEKGGEFAPGQRRRIARAVGVGAVKYGDLSSERIKDYVFDYDRMLAMDGNTSVYLQNAYVRIRSIFRRGSIAVDQLQADSLVISTPQERKLALQLFLLPQVIEGVAQSLEPHRLCNYLYELASSYHAFYERCPVLTAENETLRQSRLLLIELVARALRLGLSLLGIEAVEQM